MGDSVVKTSERLVNGEKFYPIHLTNGELSTIIHSLLKITGIATKPRVQVILRKDKSGKGIDIRIQSVWLDYQQADKNILVTLGINPKWEVIDCFVHYYLHVSYLTPKSVDVLHGDSEEQYAGVYIPELDSIYQNRIKESRGLRRNEFFKKDEWVIVYDKQDALAD
ncbi:MAG: hypothetical protein ACO1O1_13195 [Adhaeribacter sp.]